MPFLFKFVPNTNTSLTSEDAETLTGLDLGAVFKGQEKRASFMLGNTPLSSNHFLIETSGGESDITANVEYSLDGDTWASSILISGVQPNHVTPLIHVKYTPDVNDFTTSGTFLIRITDGT